MFGLFKKKEQYKFYQYEYDVWILLCKSKSNKIHDWEVWGNAFQELDLCLQNHSETMTIRTFQSTHGTSKWLTFGRMIWSKKNNIKWTSKYKTGENKKEKLQFFGTEFWAPSWTICDKDNLSPTIFMKIDTSENGVLKAFFNESLLIATKKNNGIISQETIDKIGEKLNLEYIIKGVRSWGRKSSDISWTDALVHFSPYHLLNKKNTNALEMKESSETFGDWTILKTTINEK